MKFLPPYLLLTPLRTWPLLDWKPDTNSNKSKEPDKPPSKLINLRKPLKPKYRKKLLRRKKMLESWDYSID